jgi:hypothetical protein
MQALGNWLKAESMSKESLLSLKTMKRKDTEFQGEHPHFTNYQEFAWSSRQVESDGLIKRS